MGGAVAEALFRTGLCLPSGTALTAADLDRVTAVMRGGATIAVVASPCSPEPVLSRVEGLGDGWMRIGAAAAGEGALLALLLYCSARSHHPARLRADRADGAGASR